MIDLYKDVIYRIILTVVNQIIIKLVSFNFENNNSERKVKVLLSLLSPSLLPINKVILIHDDLIEPIKNLFR